MELVSPKGSRWAAAGEGGWSHAQNKQFEDALAVFDKDTPDRWQKVAAIIPGKSVGDIIRHYQELEDDVGKIEAGLLPESGGEKERKKGVPWTQEEHKLFLMGLKKHGRGDWRNISRNFVVTRTPTQVASHAQKYFIRQVSGAKDKRRASIHDITTSTLHSQATPSYASPSANSHYPPPSAAYPEYGMNPYGMSMCNGYHHNIGFLD